MSCVVLDGKSLAAEVKQGLKGDADRVAVSLGRSPGLAVVLVGDNPASRVYVESKTKAAHACGIATFDYSLPADTTDKQLQSVIHQINERSDVDGILLQLPLPSGLNELAALSAIKPELDVDGLNPMTQGLLLRGAQCFRPCTPRGILALIDRARRELGVSADLAGLEAVVVGRSILVGKPVALMLLGRHCCVTIAHSRTRDLPGVCRRADILVVAVGKAELIDKSYVRPGAIVIDVGINRNAEGKLVGDVSFDSACENAAAVTPVPGGVGPMTIAMLLSNTVESAKRKLAKV